MLKYDLDRALKVYMHNYPTSNVRADDMDGKHYLHKLRMSAPLPYEITDSVMDIIENLRSALDQAGYGIATAGGQVPPESGQLNAKFLIGDTPQYVWSQLNATKGPCSHIPTAFRDMMWRFRPFKPSMGGHPSLWIVNKLRNILQHRVIVPCSIAAKNFIFNADDDGQVYPEGGTFDEKSLEITVARYPIQDRTHYSVSFELDVGFGSVSEIPEISGKPARPFLWNAINEVEAILFTLEELMRHERLIPDSEPGWPAGENPLGRPT